MSSTQHQLIEQCATRLRGIVEALDNIHDSTPHRWSTDLDEVHSSAESLLALIKDQAPAPCIDCKGTGFCNSISGEEIRCPCHAPIQFADPAQTPVEQFEQAPPSEDQLTAAGLSYPLAKEDAVKLWYAGFRSEVVTVLEAWEAIGHDIGMNPSKGELLDSLRNMAAICDAHGNDMPAQSVIDQRQVIADAITGALAFGAQASQPPAEDHWLRPFYDIGRAEGQRTQELAMLVRMLASSLKRHAPESNLVARATNYLAAKGLAGTPLRDAPASVEQAGGDERAALQELILVRDWVKNRRGQPEKLKNTGQTYIMIEKCETLDMLEWAIERARAALARPSPAQAEQAEGAHVPDEVFAGVFAEWWEEEGQYCRAGGGDYERTFAFQAWRHLYPLLLQARAALAHDEQEQAAHEIRLLANALGECIQAAGITAPGVPLTGPQLLMFAEDLKRDLQRAALAQPSPLQAEQPTADDYEEVLADHRRLVRELDVLLNGEDGAARQASLCDLVAQVRAVRQTHDENVPADNLGQSLLMLEFALMFALCNFQHAGSRNDVKKAQTRLQEVLRFLSGKAKGFHLNTTELGYCAKNPDVLRALAYEHDARAAAAEAIDLSGAVNTHEARAAVLRAEAKRIEDEL
ncbi:hypothetical protein ACM742_07695 [Pseudomonas aeruginosa]